MTVLAALPGWGRTTWLRQCRSYQLALTRARGDTSTLLRTFADSSTLRRFSADMLAEARGEIDRSIIDRSFARLSALPLGTLDVDNETGLETFQWEKAARPAPPPSASNGYGRPRAARQSMLGRQPPSI